MIARPILRPVRTWPPLTPPPVTAEEFARERLRDLDRLAKLRASRRVRSPDTDGFAFVVADALTAIDPFMTPWTVWSKLPGPDRHAVPVTSQAIADAMARALASPRMLSLRAAGTLVGLTRDEIRRIGPSTMIGAFETNEAAHDRFREARERRWRRWKAAS